jgi:predicted acyl esterase
MTRRAAAGLLAITVVAWPAAARAAEVAQQERFTASDGVSLQTTLSGEAPLSARPTIVEFWPIGNRFRAGHRLRLHVVGASAFSLPGVPALNTVSVGAGSGSRLLLPVLPGSDLGEALR